MEQLSKIFGSVEDLSPFGFLLRVFGVGVLLYLASRFLPRRAGGQYSAYDFAFFWMMGGLVAAPLFDTKNSFAFVVVSIATIYIWHYIISYIMVRSRTMAQVFGGMAIPLVQGGVVLKQNMRKALFPLELLFAGLRQADAHNLAEVETAVLETSGHVSVLKKSDHQPVTAGDLKIPIQQAVLPVILVNDGRIMKKNLRKINQDETWLNGQLKKYGVLDLKNVYLAGIDSSGRIFYSLTTTS